MGHAAATAHLVLEESDVTEVSKVHILMCKMIFYAFLVLIEILVIQNLFEYQMRSRNQNYVIQLSNIVKNY